MHVARSDGLTGAGVSALAAQRVLVESLGGSYHSIIGENIPTALLEFAQANNATQIVLGASRRSALMSGLTGPGTGATITRRSGPIDVHMVSHDYAGSSRRLLPALTGGLTVRRRIAGLGVAVVLLTGLTLLGTALRAELSLGSDLLLYLLAVVVVSLAGGFYPAVLAAVAGSLLLNFYFVPPIHRFTISQPENVLALTVFLVVAALVSQVVDLAARRTSQAARATAEAETLATLAGSLLRGEQALPALMGRIRETFTVDSVTLLRRDNNAPASAGSHAPAGSTTGLRGSWSQVASIGESPCLRPEDGDTEVEVGEDLTLVLRGRVLPAEDQRILSAFASQVAVAYRQRQLLQAAAAAVPLAEADRMRTALLNAVGHDLRTPLAAAKAAVSGLRSPGITWSHEDRAELLGNADEALDRLSALVTNLLDLSRLQAGALSVVPRPVGLDDVVSMALFHEAHGHAVELDVPPELPEVLADPGLLDRVVANLVQNALRYAPPGQPIRLAASSHAGRVELRIVDRGPGIPAADRDTVFAPFQRLDDSPRDGAGVGLGLAIARGFTEAMGGRLVAEDTPGGGLTMVVDLPCAPGNTASSDRT